MNIYVYEIMKSTYIVISLIIWWSLVMIHSSVLAVDAFVQKSLAPLYRKISGCMFHLWCFAPLLGTLADGRNRPILVKMPSKAQREKVLKKTKNLKEAGPAFKKVYVRKDVHPATRREWKRLKDAEKSEKEKPGNEASTITLDYKARVLLCDNVMIDRWKPTYFQ